MTATDPLDVVPWEVERPGMGSPERNINRGLRRAGMPMMAPGNPSVRLDHYGQSYRVTADKLGAMFLFRDVSLGGSGSCSVAVTYRDRHLFRLPSTFGAQARNTIARTARELAGDGSPDDWTRATFAAFEAAQAAEETLSGDLDLRDATGSLGRPLWTAGGFLPDGAGMLVMPGEAGKSTIARAIAAGKAAGRDIIPGIDTASDPGPVLLVAAEDPVAAWHARNLEAICRGAGIERAAVRHEIAFFRTSGRPLHRIARSLAERAEDAALVILDSQQALLSSMEQTGIRDRDSLFWNGVDTIDRPTLILAHPNRAESRGWNTADGRAAGSEVNRDRARISWRGTFKDEPATVGTTYRRYLLTCVKYNHGPRPEPIPFAACWEYGYDGDPGTLRFVPAEPIEREAAEPRPLSESERRTLAAFREGATTPAALLAVMPDLGNVNAAKARLHRLREKGAIGGAE